MFTRAVLLKALAGGLLMGRYSGPPNPQAINPLPPGGAPDIATRVKALTQPFTDAQMSDIAAGIGATAAPGIPREAQGYHVLNQTGATVYLSDAGSGSLFAKIPPWFDVTGPMDETDGLKFMVLATDPLFPVSAFPSANWDVRFELFSKQLPVQLVQLQTTGQLSTSPVSHISSVSSVYTAGAPTYTNVGGLLSGIPAKIHGISGFASTQLSNAPSTTTYDAIFIFGVQGSISGIRLPLALAGQAQQLTAGATAAFWVNVSEMFTLPLPLATLLAPNDQLQPYIGLTGTGSFGGIAGGMDLLLEF